MDIHISPLIFSEIVLRRDINCNLRSNSKCVVPNVRSDFCGIESVSYLGPEIWNIVLLELKELTTVDAFKKGINQWKSKNCQYGQLLHELFQHLFFRFIVYKVSVNLFAKILFK